MAYLRRSEADGPQEVVAHLCGGQRRGTGVVPLDGELMLLGVVDRGEDPGEVDYALTGVGERAAGRGPRHVLDVELLDPVLVGGDELDRVAMRVPGPIEVDLEVHKRRIGCRQQDVVTDER